MLTPLLRSVRPYQWGKNLFVLAPVVFAQRLTDSAALGCAVLAFAAFCAAASSAYLLNDVKDREADRRHPLKRQRPIASGALPVSAALTAAALLAIGAALATLALGVGFGLFLAAYLLLNVFYTLGLKHVVIVDVMIVSIGFLLRVQAGAAAIQVDVSSWLLLCTIFISLLLVFSKRRHELVLLADDASEQRRVLSSYSPTFLDQMINVVTASAVVSYALYATAPDTVKRFGSPNLVYTVPFVLFGVFRYLYLVYQKRSERNPTEALLSDKPFLANLLLWGLAVLWIVYGGG
jgi:4-hydroxybenzoate polyprenyltransferase